MNSVVFTAGHEGFSHLVFKNFGVLKWQMGPSNSRACTMKAGMCMSVPCQATHTSKTGSRLLVPYFVSTFFKVVRLWRPVI